MNTENPHLLIAEDDEALSAILDEYLSDYGYQITCASRGDEALALLKHTHFDIILSDIVMPGGGGLSILDASCSDPAKTLVLLMTGYSGIEDAIHAVERGAYDFVSKPFQLPEMKVRIDNATRYQSLLRKCAHHDTYKNFEVPEGFVAYRALDKPHNAAIQAYNTGKLVHHV
ncbi:MAG: response regulator [Zetaproteobacteria bacterium]|nr:MAG: response regulator [Zetaproteobacteria bacterium]